MAILISFGILAIIVGLLFYNARATQQWHNEHPDDATITETDHYYGHLFYSNNDDRRIFVPKRSGGGYTLNFGNPLSILVVLLFLAILFAIITLS